MPIKTENRARYPKDWPEISSRVRNMADHKCQWCRVPNRAWGYRDAGGRFHECPRDGFGRDYGRPPFDFGAYRIIEIILTVAHLDHTPENCDPSNLVALCQRCHLRYDAAHHRRTRANTLRAALQVRDLFDA